MAAITPPSRCSTRKSTADVLGPQEVELWRGRIRTRALEADSQSSVQLPVDVGLPPDANWNAAPLGLRPRQTWPIRRAASRWWPMRRPTGPRPGRCRPVRSGAARANLLAGNPQKFAPYLKRAALHGRTFYGLIAQKALGMRIEPDWDVPRARSLPGKRHAQRPRRPPRARLAAARRRDRGRARALRRLDRRRSALQSKPSLAVAQKASLPSLSAKVGNANWDQRHNIKALTARSIRCRRGSPRAAIPSTARCSGVSCARNRRSTQGALLCSAPWG